MNDKRLAGGFAPFVLAAVSLRGFGFQSVDGALHRQALAGSRIGVEHAGAGNPHPQQGGAVVGAVAAAPRSKATKAAAPATGGRSIPRTPDGKPDFQGMWLNNTATPLERPRAFANRAFFSEAEAAEWERTYQMNTLRGVAIANNVDPDFAVAATGIEIGTFEPGHVTPDRRTSLIVDPPDGKLPPLTPDAQRREAATRDSKVVRHTDGPENQTNAERCLVVGNTAVPPLMPNLYNNHLQILQTRDHVTLVSEMIHDARTIPLNPRPHLPPTLRQWKGDSVGRWEGDTLVVDTTNFNGQVSFRGSGPNMSVTERLSFVDPNTLSYEFTVNDPDSFTRPFTAQSVLVRTESSMFEYACHEGNYSMTGILGGGRAVDDKGAAHETDYKAR